MPARHTLFTIFTNAHVDKDNILYILIVFSESIITGYPHNLSLFITSSGKNLQIRFPNKHFISVRKCQGIFYKNSLLKTHVFTIVKEMGQFTLQLFFFGHKWGEPVTHRRLRGMPLLHP